MNRKTWKDQALKQSLAEMEAVMARVVAIKARIRQFNIHLSLFFIAISRFGQFFIK
jgi:hypothetical protein